MKSAMGANPRSSLRSFPSIAGTKSLAIPTYADAIMDRLVHNAHRIELTGESLRRARAKSTIHS